MATNADSRAKLQSSFQELTAAADTLNTVSDALGAAISKLDAAFKKLNLGVSAWITFQNIPHENMPQYSAERRLGYAKVRGERGLALRVVEVDSINDEEEVSEEWLLADAPRELRLLALDHIQKLIDALVKQAALTAKRVKVKADEAIELADTIEAIADGQAGGRQ